ncbi:MAG: DUF4382 domain-containing protein, partial [Acidobacteria bacterium]|nr:DUF4382 domain-containing protein [Acidobacteriota bacterium]
MMRSFASPRSVGGLLVFALVLLAAGCSGSSTTPPPGQAPGALSGSLALFGQDAPLDNLVKFEITVTGITLNPGNVQVSLPAGGVRLELTSLQITTDLIRLDQNIPAGTYTSVDLTLANPEIKFRDETTGAIVELEDTQLPLQTSSVTINVSFSIAQGQLTALLFDFDLRAMLVTDPATDAITGIDPTVNFTISLVNVAGDVGEFEDEIGRVVSVNATDSTFDFEPFSSCQQVTITTDTATVFEDFGKATPPLADAFASLQVDQIVEVDADLRVDGTFLAEKVEFEDDAMEDEIEGLIVEIPAGARDAVTGAVSQFKMVLFDVAPCTANLPADDIFTVNVPTTVGAVEFRIDEDDLSVDPALFDGPEDLEVGQKVDVDPAVADVSTITSATPITAEKIKLEDQTIRGTVASSPGATTFELIPAADLFRDPNNSITVQISSVTRFDSPLTGIA